MLITRCHDCGTAVSRHCKKCPVCCARYPALRRPSPLGPFIAVVILGCVVFLAKTLKPAHAEWQEHVAHPAPGASGTG